MAEVKSVFTIFLIILIIAHTFSKPHYNRRSILKHRSKREEITPQNSYFNPGSEEKARLDFEEQHSEDPAASASLDGSHFVGQDLASIRETNAFSTEKEAEELQSKFLSESEVQKGSLAFSSQPRESLYSQNFNPSTFKTFVRQDYGNEAANDYNSYGLGANFQKSEMREGQQNPFLIPAGYPDEEGAKKSIVTKQNLPFNEPHPEGKHPHVTEEAIFTHDNDSWTGVSRYPPTRIPTVTGNNSNENTAVVAGLSLPPGGQPSSYNVQVSGNTNGGYVTTASKVEAKYPAATTTNENTQNTPYNETKSSGNETNAKQETTSSVEYLVPPPSQIFDQSAKPLNKQPVDQTNLVENPKQITSSVYQQPLEKAPLPVAQVYSAEATNQTGAQTAVYPQQVPISPYSAPASAAVAKPDNKLDQSPVQTGPKIPSAKNYPVGLIWLASSRKTGLKILKTEAGHQLLSENQGTSESPAQQPPPEQKPQQAQQQQVQQQQKPAEKQQQSGQQQQQPVQQQSAQQQQQSAQQQPVQQQQQPMQQQQQPPSQQQPVQLQQTAQQQQQPTAQQQQQPAQQQQKPAQQQQQPAQQQQQPVQQKPVQQQQQPLQQQPVQQQQQPAQQQQQPVQQQPAQQQQQPVQQQQQTAQKQPAQQQQQPAKQQPVQQQQQPAQQQQQPAQQQQQPAQQQQQSGQQLQKPASTQYTQDHVMCPQYPISRCNENWIMKNCRYRCKVNIESSTAVPMKSPYQASQTTDASKNTTCAQTTGGNSNNACCVFPFIYRGIPYNSCILPAGQTYWCSTTLNFDVDGRWGFCGSCPMPPCPVTTPAPTTSTPPTTQATTTQATATPATTTQATTTQATTTQATTTQATTTQATTTQATTTQVSTTPAATTQATTTQVSTTPATTTQATTTQATTTQATTTQATTTQATTTQATTTQATTTQSTTTQSTTPKALTTPAIPPQKVCGPWSAWTQCDKNCGGGQQYRYRNCTKTVLVDEVEVEKQPCNSHSCSMICGNWTQWSECSASCGYGYRQRFRNCTLNGELKIYMDRKSCYVADCPPVCDEWTEWSTCSKSCDGGLQQRRRNCTITDGIQSVTQIFSENRLCNTEPCSPDCEQWSAWTPCTKSCGEGTQYRYTNCTSNDGENKMYYDHRVCNTQACPPVCGKWNKWSECTKTCNGGSQHRTRNCTIEDQGKNDTFSEGEVQECNTQPCPPVCGEWTSWSECSKTCGGGDQQRTRNCTVDQAGQNVSYGETEVQDCNTQICPTVTCGQWSAWSECSKTCGGGDQQRTRNCTVDQAGQNVSYGETEVQDCNTQICPTVTCGQWSAWSECSKSCGGGSTYKIRHCARQDQNGNYTYDEMENEICNTQACPPSYNCSEWGPWTECTVTCGGGQSTRVRQCTRDDGATLIIPETQYCNMQPCEKICGQWSSFGPCPVPCGGGLAERWRTCNGKVEEEESPCNTFPCPTAAPPAPSNLTTPAPEVCFAWSEWSPCSATCNGMQTRVRHCKNATHESDQLEARPCNTLPCENATTTPATMPSTTPATTPSTTPATTPSTTPATTPSTTPATTPSNTTTPADNKTTPSTPITTTTTPPTNCSEWSQWSQCTRTCGGGYQERFRTCEKFEQEIQSRICNTQPCPSPSTSPAPQTTPKPKPGPFPECLLAYLSFDKVDQERNIVFDEGPYHNDAQLDGNLTFVNGNFSCGYAASLEGGEIIFDGTKFHPKPSAAVTIAAWIYIQSNVQRQTLFATRAGNSQDSDNFYLEIEQGKIRWYHIHPTGRKVFYMVTESLLPEKTWVHVAGSYNVVNGKVRFFVNAEEAKVTLGEGPLTTDWDTYAKIAGGGSGTKFRGIIDEFYIFNCSLIDEQIRVVADTCKLREGEECPSPLLGVCPPCENCTTAIPPTQKPEGKIDGGYGSWSNWTHCSVTCGVGVRTRHRECNNPEPQFGGLSCIDQGFGPEDETVACDSGPCPVDGSWSNWGAWSSCSVTCGIGYKTHWRQCDNPRPQFGGKFCNGPDISQDECRQIPCPVNGNYTTWTAWSECSVSCGNGTKYRVRDCANPAPKYGGRDCKTLGPSEEIEGCLKDPCPRDGGWSQWSAWSQCSKTCGDGTMRRVRTCDSPAPANGGAFCAGEASSVLYCKEAECCEIPYQDIGCYKDSGAVPRPLPELLFTDRDPKDQVYSGIPIHGQDFEDYSMDLICRCARRTKDKQYTHFAIQEYGECYSGPNVAKTYNKEGEEKEFRFRPDAKPWVGCMGTDFKKCKRPSLTCVGQEFTNFVYGLANVTAVDGNYTEWSPWSECSAPCGEGTQSRIRECTNPKPTFGGKNCSRIGDPTEARPCSIKQCEVPGNWGGWSNWTACSVKCGEGMRQRTRECDSPAPANGGPYCPGSNSESEICENEPCPVNCSWSSWSQWSSCSVTCGEGVRLRHRDDDDPPALYGGDECVGPAADVQPCFANIQCATDGNYTNWSEWGACSRSCGGGFKIRGRTCTNPSPSNNGKDCSDLGPTFETMDCGTAPCVVNGNYSDWSDWSLCDKTCGEGIQQRARKCDNPSPINGGKNCSLLGPPVESQICNLTSCPVDGNFTEWSAWSSCSKTCGQGQIFRSRSCSNPLPQFGGKFCVGNDTEARICNLGPCCNIPYKDIGCFADTTQLAAGKPLPEMLFDDQQNIDHAYWNEYMENVICRCANAAFEKEYTHFSLQSYAQCFSGPNVAKTYNKDGASKSCVGQGGSPSKGDYQSCSVPNLFCVGADKANYVFGLKNVSAVNGNYTEWSSWSTCTQPCGPGTMSRYRSCTNPSPAFGGKDCSGLGPADEVQGCEIKKCPVDGAFSPWTDWSECSKTCGDGEMFRFRLCNSPAPAYGGKNCSGDVVQEQSCHLKPCSVDGNYTEWGEFSRCSVSCGNGTKIRQRSCTNPRPENGGKTCLEKGLGEDTDEETCNNGPCPQDGEWCEWTPWSLCSKTCGAGVRNRTRDCACPQSQNGGAVCPGSGEEARYCLLTPCAVNGNYTEWTSWSSCDKPCGNGTRTRSRACSNPPPAYGGKTCIEQGFGDDTEDEKCFLSHCPINGNFSQWTPWSACSATCGDGVQVRNRSCTNPAAKFDGNDCVGDYIQQKYCKLGECCDIPYKDIGCFADKGGSIRPLPEMLFNDEAKRKSDSWEEFLPDLICSCAKAAKEKTYAYFGIQNYAECWSGANVKDTYDLDGASKSCQSAKASDNVNATNAIDKFETCTGNNLLCAGKQGANYVYGLENVVVVDGNYTEWSSWGNCSALCGGGTKQRSRTCTNPSPSFGGKDCSALGAETSTEICNTKPCPVNGNWGLWTEWSACSKSCDNGTIERKRICNNPAPQHGGEPCENPDTASQVMMCNLGPCPVDAVCHGWGSWSPCSTTCGTGNKTRTRICSEPLHGGKACTCSKFDSLSCMIMSCPLNGNWGDWSPWNTCSKTCGSGMRNRTRVCDRPEPKYGGQACNGSTTENMACNEGACPIDGGFTEWSGWDECSELCGGGKSQRTRSCTNPKPQFGGRNCSLLGPASEELVCNEQPCPQNGGFTEWSEWSSCSSLCGEGIQVSNRTCTNPEPKYNGTDCIGDRKKSRACKIQDCCKTPYKRLGCYQDKQGPTRPLPELLFDQSSNASHLIGSQWNAYLLELVCKCAEQSKLKKYTHFGLQDYGKCYSGPGVDKTFDKDGASNQCIANSINGPVPNGSETHSSCSSTDSHCAGKANATFVYGLEYAAVDGNYTQWSSWQPCSRSCDIGTSYRMRNCTNPSPAFGGKNCSSIGPDTDVKPCEVTPCPVNGNWGAWSNPTPCSVTCGNGTSRRTRQCDQPAPANGGVPCPGNSTVEFSCSLRPCAINGSWSQWTAYSACSKTCGEGKRQRTRLCNNPAPNEFGTPCEGNSVEVVSCNNEPCFGTLTQWGQWSSCSRTCGDGIRTRNRTCEGGDTCAGDLSEIEPCSMQPCPQSCQRKLDLGFVHDTSSSLSENDFEKAKKFILAIASSFTISQVATRVSYLQFGTNPDDSFKKFIHHNSYLEFEQNIYQKSLGSSSFINRALASAETDMYSSAAGDRSDVPDILVVLTDGNQTPELKSQYPSLDDAAKKLKNRGVTVIALGVGDESRLNFNNLRSIATSENHMFTIGSYDEAFKLIFNVSATVCGVDKEKWSEWTSWSNCSAACGNGTRERTRYCQGGTAGQGLCSGNTTEVSVCINKPCAAPTTPPPPFKCSEKIDMALIIDSSSSITDHWEDLKGFLMNIIEPFSIGENGTMVSVVTYATSPRKVWSFDPKKTKELLLLDIKTLQQVKGGTRIDLALRFAAENVFLPEFGHRPATVDVAIVLTDGKSDVGSEPLLTAVGPLREKGVHVIAVGLGKDIDVNELRTIITDKDHGLFLIQDFNKMVQYVESLAKEICYSTQRAKPKPIYSGYTCQPSLLYTFDKICDKVVYDESGKGNNGQLIGQTMIKDDDPKCKKKIFLVEAGGVKIDGTNFRGKPSTQFTFASWFNILGFELPSNHQVFVAHDSSGRAQLAIQITPNGAFNFTIANGNELVFSALTANDIFKFYSWHHVAITFDIKTKQLTIYYDGIAVTSDKYVSMQKKGPEIFSMDWSGFTGLATDHETGPKNQLSGAIDELYLFPCVLSAADIDKVKSFCGEFDPFSGPYPGAQYKIYSGVSSGSLAALSTEISSKQPIYSSELKDATAPNIATISSQFSSPIGDSAFAAKISGYFVPPLTGRYKLTIGGYFMAMLSFSVEQKSIKAAITNQTSFDGDTKSIRNSSVLVNLQAGAYYYYEVLQLSSDQLNKLDFHFQMICPDGSDICSSTPIQNTYLQARIPNNCSDIVDRYDGMPDDEYMIRMDPNCDVFSVFCYNMNSLNKSNRALEYITLPAGGNENYAMYYRPRLQNYATCSGPEIATPSETEKYWGQTWFQKIRVVPSSLIIETRDFTFSETIGRQMEYGRAGDCYSNSKEDCRKGQFKINVEGTNLKLNSSLQWVATGTPQDDYRITQFKMSPSNTEVSAHCGGSCSECMPAEHLRLKPEICMNTNTQQLLNSNLPPFGSSNIDIGHPPATSKPKNKRSIREKRAKDGKKGRKNKWWSWWPFW